MELSPSQEAASCAATQEFPNPGYSATQYRVSEPGKEPIRQPTSESVCRPISQSASPSINSQAASVSQPWLSCSQSWHVHAEGRQELSGRPDTNRYPAPPAGSIRRSNPDMNVCLRGVGTIRNTQILVYINSVRNSQETHYVTATKTNRLMLFRETVAVYCGNHTEHTEIVSVSEIFRQSTYIFRIAIFSSAIGKSKVVLVLNN
jgi:hypothetical protein